MDGIPCQCQPRRYNLWCLGIWIQLKKALQLVKESFDMICAVYKHDDIAA